MWEKIRLCVLVFPLIFLSACKQKEGGEMKPKSIQINFQEGDLPTIHPQDTTIYLRGIGLAKALYEGLTRLDSQGNPELAGAVSVDISEDQLHYTFHLREHLWSDGSPVTAFQYEASWKALLSPTSTSPRAELLYLLKNGEAAKKGLVSLDAVGVKALDVNTLEVELAYPSPYLFKLLAQPTCFPMADVSLKEPKLFNGAFTVDRWEKGETISLKKNPYFWNQEKVNLDRIDVSVIQDLSTVYRLYRENLLDWIGVPLCPMTIEQIKEMRQSNQTQTHPVHRLFWVFLNVDHPLLASKDIRKAFALAANRKEITTHILLEGNPLLKPIPEVFLRAEDSGFLEEDRALAKELFEKGLKELGIEREGLPPLVYKYAQQANRKQLAEYLSQTWSELFGIQVEPVLEEWNSLRTNLAKGNFEVCGGSYDAPFYGDPLELLERYTSKNINNYSQWTNPAYTDVIQEAKQEADPNRRVELLARAEKILLDEMPIIPICSDQFIFSHIPGLEGYVFDSVGAIDLTYSKLVSESQ